MPMLNTTTAALLGGAAGAVSLNLMHECARKTVPNAPRVDIIGMRGVEKISTAMGLEPPRQLRTTTFAADLISNALYYSAVGARGRRNAVGLGAALGLAAGLGGVLLPEPMGLGGAEVNRTRSTQVMTVGMYFAAGCIAGGIYNLLAGRCTQGDRRALSEAR
jgi:hypothetical protein